jgi:1,4-dihydroxy-6-naphthoate synthase
MSNNNNRISLGFSPCPNDTFIFDAMVNHKIDTEGLDFEYVFADVEELNNKAFRQELDVTKISYHAFLYLTDDFLLLRSGSALGINCGPLLISKNPISDLSKATIAIPGKHTTANYLFSLFAPDAKNKKEVLFSEIENQVLLDEVDAGVIIHENRFTYQDKGLIKIADLGEFWESQTKIPIPLGGIIANKKLGLEMISKINRILRNSVKFAFDNPDSSKGFVSNHSQEMADDVVKKHIALYVNDFSIDLGEKGLNAISFLFEKAKEANLIKDYPKEFYINDF